MVIMVYWYYHQWSETWAVKVVKVMINMGLEPQLATQEICPSAGV
jgi:hypothetical protein